MTSFTEQLKIDEILGKAYPQNITKLETIGSPRLYLESSSVESLPEGSICNLEKRPQGILIHSNLSNKITLLPIRSSDLKNLTLTRGYEIIKTKFPYPMWFLLKCGVPIIYARYFRFRPFEYSIEPLKLEITSVQGHFVFNGLGYNFERMQAFTESLNLPVNTIVEP